MKVVPHFEHLLGLVLSGKSSEFMVMVIRQSFANSSPGRNTGEARVNWRHLAPQLTKCAPGAVPFK
jgi:hypothetical protein